MGVVFMCRGKDDLWRMSERSDQLRAEETGHVDVKEDEVYRVLFQELHCFQRVMADAGQQEIVGALQVSPEYF